MERPQLEPRRDVLLRRGGQRQQRDRSPGPDKWAGRPIGAGCRASLRAAQGAHGGVRPQPDGFNHLSTTPPWWGSCRYANARPGCVRSGSSCPRSLFKAADLAVAQTVVDEGEELACCRHPGDGHAPAIGDAMVVGLDLRPAAELDTASTAAQRASFEPCLVTRPRRTLASDSRCLGVSPAHEHSACGVGKRETSPTSAAKTAARTRPTPSMAWMAW